MGKSAGFTLIELIVTLTVAGILAAIAVPSFKTTIQNNRLATESNDLLGAMLYARSQAISGGSHDSTTPPLDVAVCASTLTGTNPSCDTTDWSKGWIVEGYPTAPSAAPGSATNLAPPAATATVMRVYGALPSGTTLNGSAYDNNLGSVAFTSNGNISSNTPYTGSMPYFILCDSRGKTFARAIYLGTSGEARVSTTPGQYLDGTSIDGC